MYWILLIFLMIGFVYPAVGFIAIICMIGPVVLAISRGRYWCGNVCPRGNFYDRIMKNFSPRRPIPRFFRRRRFRYFMIGFIFVVFGVQMSRSWGDIAAMGDVFVQIILLTTLVGIVLGRIYHERTWCTFCPMGTLSALVTPKVKKSSAHQFKVIKVSAACVNCKHCGKACPMQLTPYAAKEAAGFLHEDCLKCGKCIECCPKKALRFE